MLISQLYAQKFKSRPQLVIIHIGENPREHRVVTCCRGMMERFLLNSHVRGHHVYKVIWSPEVGEMLLCQPEFGNIQDLYAVSIATGKGLIVGHAPRKISAICNLFLRRGGYIVCQKVHVNNFHELPPIL